MPTEVFSKFQKEDDKQNPCEKIGYYDMDEFIFKVSLGIVIISTIIACVVGFVIFK